MKHIIEEIIFTDKKKDGTSLINKAGRPFFMLHIKVDDMGQEKWISKYYSTDQSQKLLEELKVGQEYDFIYETNGEYNNLISLTKRIIG